eukprot:scaffold1934_cov79-Cylindrotheca_fusiformis.AAC.14
MTETPTFEPRDGSPTIHVNVRTIRENKQNNNDVQRMYQEHAQEEQRAKEEAAQNKNDNDDNKLRGPTVYDFAPATIYEYDVVKCADYVEDIGCWVRNMPQEIKDANPNFVPT